MTRALLVLALLLAPGVAHAGNVKAAAKKFVTAQAQSFVGGDVDKIVPTFTDDALLIAGPRAAVGTDAIRDLLGEVYTDAHDLIEEAEVRNLTIGVLDGAAWVTADFAFHWVGYSEGGSVDYGWGTLRVTELVVRDGKRWKARAAHISPAIDDRDAKAMVKEDFVPDPAVFPGSGDESLRQLLASPVELSAALDKDKAVAVLGSAPKERAIGPAKAKKLLKKWTKLAFETGEDVYAVEGDGWELAAANVTLGDVTYRVLAIFKGVGADARRLVSLHYSTPTFR